jgi:hypothetical protein
MNRVALIAGAVTGLVLALALGAVLGHRAAPKPVATQALQVGPATLVVPRDWPAPGERALVKVAPIRSPSESARATMLAGYRAWREGTVTVLPTSTGVVTVDCAACTDAIQTVSVRGAAILDPTPDLALALRAPDVVAALDKARVRGRDELRQATTPADQSRWARRLAAAHTAAAVALRPVAGPDLLERLTEVRTAYSDLATAATARSATDFDAARARIRTAESKLTRSLGGITPAPVQPPAAAPAPVVSHELPRPLLMLVITVFAGLGAGLALSSGRRRAESAPEAQAATPAPPPRWLATLKSSARERPRPERAPSPARAVSATAQPLAERHARTDKPAAPARRPRAAAATASRAGADRPAAKRPATKRPATKRPAASGAGTERPPLSAPVSKRQAASGSVAKRQAASAADTERPPLSAPVSKRQAASGSAAKRPAASGSVAKRQTASGSAAERPAASGSATTRPAASGSATERPAASGSAAERPAASGSAAERPAASDPKTERPPLSAPVVERPVTRDPVVAAKGGAAKRPHAPVPPGTKWTCELAWSANLRRAAFRVEATAPGETTVEVARSRKLNWPPLMPPTPQADIVAAARSVAKALVEAGWTPTSKGSDWYAQRFAWARDGSPPPLGTV